MHTLNQSPSKKDQHIGIFEIVEQLRELRTKSLVQRQRIHKPPKLPSKAELTNIIEGFAAALFPNRLGLPDIEAEGIDAYVAFTLDKSLRELNRQLRREIAFNQAVDAESEQIAEAAFHITRQFAAALPSIRSLLDSDIEAAFEGDPAARTPDEVIVCYPGITAMIHHRLAHVLYQNGATLTARIVAEIAHGLTGIDIHPGANIGSRFFIDHGTGVVIGETAIIGSNVRIYQAVTLGAKRFAKNSDGSLVKGNLRHPIVEDNVVIYAGATILGRITIGKGAVIGGNVWVTQDVPANALVTQ
jgi:serine O-acetyltransferase